VGLFKCRFGRFEANAQAQMATRPAAIDGRSAFSNERENLAESGSLSPDSFRAGRMTVTEDMGQQETLRPLSKAREIVVGSILSCQQDVPMSDEFERQPQCPRRASVEKQSHLWILGGVGARSTPVTDAAAAGRVWRRSAGRRYSITPCMASIIAIGFYAGY
jgi:hypothetical protein